MEKTKNCYCGYCKKHMHMTWEEFSKHLEWCETDCCDKKYGGLSGK